MFHRNCSLFLGTVRVVTPHCGKASADLRVSGLEVVEMVDLRNVMVIWAGC
jgi:hypothetical protein